MQQVLLIGPAGSHFFFVYILFYELKGLSSGHILLTFPRQVSTFPLYFLSRLSLYLVSTCVIMDRELITSNINYQSGGDILPDIAAPTDTPSLAIRQSDVCNSRLFERIFSQTGGAW